MDESLASVLTDKDDFLKPLLAQKSELAAELKRRRNPDDVQSVHPADVAELTTGGWTLKREGKRKSSVSRPKPHDRWLEDRVWCLAYSMGYSVLNGDRFNISFERDNGTKGRKQIDVYAADGESVMVVECKSR